MKWSRRTDTYLVGFPFDVDVGESDGERRVGVGAEVDLFGQRADGRQRRVLVGGIAQRNVVETQPTTLFKHSLFKSAVHWIIQLNDP